MKKQKGFTLVELLVTIAIMGILASMVGLSTLGSRVKARDARRMTDLRSVIVAQELYYSDMERYFTCSATAGDCNPRSDKNFPSSIGNRMLKTPTDPRNSGTTCAGGYMYCGLDNTLSPQQFCYYAKLEENATAFIAASPRGLKKKDAVPTDFTDCGLEG